MDSKDRKRALFLVGAGASVEFGVDSTEKLTDALAREIASDERMLHSGASLAFEEISTALASYYRGGRAAVNFEQVFHCAHELLFAFPPTAGAINQYRPALVPFLTHRLAASEKGLRALCGGMTEMIHRRVSEACAQPAVPTTALAGFLGRMRSRYLTRIYTTNYDDFILQAAPDLHTGFDAQAGGPPSRFQGREFWSANNQDCVYHLHGSVHLGFCCARTVEMNELVWYDDREEALSNSSHRGTGLSRMDGSTVDASPIITGLDKLSRIQQSPFRHFYSALAGDAMRADVVFVVGCGLGDLHLNSWVKDARLQPNPPPIVLVDYWKDGFVESSAYNQDDPKLVRMWHSLRMPLGFEPHMCDPSIEGWTLDRGRTCAVWSRGFQAFLNAPGNLDAALAVFGLPSISDG